MVIHARSMMDAPDAQRGVATPASSTSNPPNCYIVRIGTAACFGKLISRSHLIDRLLFFLGQKRKYISKLISLEKTADMSVDEL